MRVAEVWRFPVKSALGEVIATTEVLNSGVCFDRHWAVLDVERKRLLSAKEEPRMLYLGASIVEGLLKLHVEGTSASDVDASLSTYLNRSVTVVASGDDVPHVYSVGEDPEDGYGSTLETFHGAEGSFQDSRRAQITITTRETIALFGGAPARFRMNVILDSGDERELLGRRIRIGSVILDVVKEVDRCVMVTRGQPGLDRDLSVLKRINHDRMGSLGVGALVVLPGEFSVGDSIHAI